MTTQNSTIIVYSGIPLDNTYQNVVHGGITVSALKGASTHWKSWSNQSWCRINGLFNNKVRIDCSPNARPNDYFMSDELLTYNYISITNSVGTAYKTIYGFITNVLYINDNVAEITFDIDVFHTYYSNYSFGECIIERTNISSDSEGDYTLKEPVDLGNEYVINYQHTVDLSECDLIIQTALPRESTDITRMGGMWNMGVHTYAVDRNCSGSEMSAIISQIANKGLLSTYYCPVKFSRSGGTGGAALNNEIYNSNYSAENPRIGIDGSLDGYTPRHKKLLCYPYRYIEVTNMQGQRQIYKCESFANPSLAEFVLVGTAYPSPYGYLYPKNYNGIEHAFDYGVPIQSFASNMMNSETMDYYWGTHKNQIIMNTINQGATGAMSGAMTGAAMGSVIGGVGAIPGAIAGAFVGGISGAGTSALSNYAQIQDIGNSASNYIGVGGTDNINVVSGFCGFHINVKSIRADIAESIDDFFTRYGYNYQRLGTPPIDGSYNYKYIKTNGCNLISNSLPMGASNIICQIHDKGVTYWSSLSTIGTY